MDAAIRVGADRRAEIVGPIKAAFAPLDYEHHDR